MNAGIVYCVTNRVNGKRYVGITTQPLQDRFKFHLRGSGGCRRLQAAIKHHGPDAFNVEQIDTGDTQECLSTKERAWIARLGTLHPDGYNLSAGGASNMIVHDETRGLQSASAIKKWESDAARARVSEQMKRKWADSPESVVCHTWSDEAREKRQATFADPEWKRLKAISAKESNGRPAVREKISAASKASWKDPAYAEAALAGLRRPETLAKRAETRNTLEWRALQSAKTKAAMARPDVRMKLIAAAAKRTGKKLGPYKARAKKRSDYASPQLPI